MAKSLMSKSQTGVFLFFYTLLITMNVSSLAADTGRNTVDVKECGAQLEKYRNNDCKGKTGTELMTCLEPFMRMLGCNSVNGSVNSKCENSVKNWDTAKKDFVKACGEAKIKSGGTSGEIACSKSMRTCAYCGGEGDDEGIGGVSCESPELAVDSSTGDSNTSDIIGSLQRSISGSGSGADAIDMTPNIGEERARYTNCPALAGAELKQWQDDYKESKKTVEDLQDKINKLQQELGDMQSDAEKENVKLQEQADDIQTKAKEDAQKATENLEDQEMRAAEEVMKLNERINQQSASLRQLELGRVQAQTAFADTVSRLDLQCHSSALQRVEAERMKKMQEIQESKYSAGDMNSLFSGVGLSSRQKNEQMANEYFELCKRDRAYTMALKSAKAAFDLALQQATEGRRSIRDQIAATQAQIDDIQKTKAYKNKQRTYDYLVKIQENMNKALDKLNRQKTQLQQQFTRKFQIKNRELQQKQAKLTEEETYLKRKKEFLAMKTKMSKGIATTEDKVMDAMGKYIDLSSHGRAVKKDCDCQANGNGQAGACTAVMNFLGKEDSNTKKEYGSSQLDKAVAPDAPSPRTPSSTATPPAPAGNNDRERQQPPAHGPGRRPRTTR